MTVLAPPSVILKSDGTVNKDGSGYQRWMMVNLKVCSPLLGSFLLLRTIVLN